MEITIVSIVISILLQGIKKTKLIPKRFIPLTALVIGIFTTLVYLNPSSWQLIVEGSFYGIVLGASSVGLYELGNKQLDSIYKTLSGKYSAIASEVEEKYKNGQPVLIGTTSIDKNVIISELYLTGHGYLVNRFTNVWTAWGIIEHRCPKCNKAITNPIDWEFTLVANECIGCNHVGGDLL